MGAIENGTKSENDTTEPNSEDKAEETVSVRIKFC